jgi:O-acetylhomoserine/O-acetylserine sulfhydrylase-like pyridoxal-dependent enzyme
MAKLGFSTRQVHGGIKIVDAHGSHKPVIPRTSNFDFPNASEGAARFEGRSKGYIYTRLGSPIFDQLTSRIADLEQALAKT